MLILQVSTHQLPPWENRWHWQKYSTGTQYESQVTWIVLKQTIRYETDRHQ